jgi:hypothetical protein
MCFGGAEYAANIVYNYCPGYFIYDPDAASGRGGNWGLLFALLRYELDKAWIADDAFGLTVAWPAGGLIVGALEEVPLFAIRGDTPDG